MAWLAIVVVLLTRAGRQGRAIERLDPKLDAAVEGASTVEIIVPVRDEAANIERCLAPLLQQGRSDGRVKITVVDDASTDGTADLVAILAGRHSGLRVVTAPDLAPGWTGKTAACWFAAKESEADYLCFIDADVFAEPRLLSTAAAYAETRGLAFLSLSPRQRLVSFAERLVMPCGFYLLSFTQDLAVAQAPDGKEAVATGQFILVRREAYMSVGGHQAVRATISEDVALARVMKRAGYRVRLAAGDALLSTRMYTGWATLWIGVSKNLVDMLGGSTRCVTVAACGVALAWVSVLLPVLDASGCVHGLGGSCAALAIASLGSAAAFALHIAGSIYFRIPAWYGLLFPAGYTAGALMALDSVRRRSSGRTRWKGRVYP